MESFLDESFFQDPQTPLANFQSKLKMKMNSRIVQGIMTGEKKDGFSYPVIYTLENIEVCEEVPAESPSTYGECPIPQWAQLSFLIGTHEGDKLLQFLAIQADPPNLPPEGGLPYFYVLFFHPSLCKTGLRLSDVHAGTFRGTLFTWAMTKSALEAELILRTFPPSLHTEILRFPPKHTPTSSCPKWLLNPFERAPQVTRAFPFSAEAGIWEPYLCFLGHQLGGW